MIDIFYRLQSLVYLSRPWNLRFCKHYLQSFYACNFYILFLFLKMYSRVPHIILFLFALFMLLYRASQGPRSGAHNKYSLSIVHNVSQGKLANSRISLSVKGAVHQYKHRVHGYWTNCNEVYPGVAPNGRVKTHLCARWALLHARWPSRM